MDYRLVLLTHGAAPQLAEVVGSFASMVSPSPADLIVVHDGPGREPPVTAMGSWRSLFLPKPTGFCNATAEGWKEAAADGPDFVFWLENDFVFTKHVDLAEIVEVLRRNLHVGQMALYRGPVNRDEVEAGGYLRQHADAYTPRSTGGQPWFETTRNWTTNPSLFRRSFAAAHPWPTIEQCEGHFGFQVRTRDPRATFGIWGDGEPQVEHVGERTGFGY